jgi:hypothetical protein
MRKETKKIALITGAAMTIAAASFGLHMARVDAADHLDPPARTDPDSGGTDRGADIADVYAWHTGSGATGTLTMVLSFSGPNAAAANQKVVCDNGALYSLHIDNDGDSIADRTLEFRFGEDTNGNCFVRVNGLTGIVDGNFVARVEHVTTRGGVKVYAGLRDDAFFFDLQGFRDTLTSGNLSFVNDRDFFAGKNTSAIAVEMPLLAAQGNGTTLRVWATTGRL